LVCFLWKKINGNRHVWIFSNILIGNLQFLDENTDDRQPNVDVEVNDDSRDKGRLKAMVKPQPHILTHVIEGFVIQEGKHFNVHKAQINSAMFY
jgi:hypothetical protein